MQYYKHRTTDILIKLHALLTHSKLRIEKIKKNTMAAQIKWNAKHNQASVRFSSFHSNALQSFIPKECVLLQYFELSNNKFYGALYHKIAHSFFPLQRWHTRLMEKMWSKLPIYKREDRSEESSVFKVEVIIYLIILLPWSSKSL